jgi:hypothetical protein
MAFQKDGLTYRDLDGELIVVDSTTGYIHQLNHTGTLIWSLLSEGVSIEAIEARVSGEFDLDPETVRHDVLGFVEQLERAGLVEPQR